MITNVSVESNADTTSKVYQNIQSDTVLDLGNVRSGAFALKVSTVKWFREETGFTEIRIKCYKPSFG